MQKISLLSGNYDELGVDFSLCGMSNKGSDEFCHVCSRRLLSY